MAKRDEKPDSQWFSRQDMLDVLGMSGSGFDSGPRRLVPPDCIRGSGKSLEFHCPGVIDAIRAADRANADDPADEGIGGANSPALEELRAEKAKIARIQRMELEKRVYPHEYVWKVFGRMTQAWRTASETLQRVFGPEALRVVQEAVDSAANEMAEGFPQNDGDTASS